MAFTMVKWLVLDTLKYGNIVCICSSLQSELWAAFYGLELAYMEPCFSLGGT
jgi:hypothetical protein